MTLIRVHRITITTFIVASFVFAAIMSRRWWTGGERAALIAAIIAAVLAVIGIVYLVKAPHLRGK